MLNDPQRKGKIVVTLLGDAVMVVGAYLLCFLIRSVTTFPLGADLIPLERFQNLLHYWPALLISHAVWIYFLGFYDQYWDRSFSEIVIPIVVGVAIQTLFLGTYYAFASQSAFPRTIFPLFWLVNSTVTILWRTVLTWFFHSSEVRRVLLVGINEASARLIQLIASQKSLGLEVIGLLTESKPAGRAACPPKNGSAGVSPETFCGLPILGSVDDLEELISAYRPDEVILSSGESWQDRLIDRLGRTSGLGVRLSLLPSIYEILIGKPRHLRIRDVPLIEVASNPNPPSRLVLKRLADLLLSSLLLVALSPLLLLVAVYVRVSSPGAIFYAQERVGKDGRIFSVFKFRTMIHDAERDSGAVLSMEADPRVTPAGRFLRTTRLDELPQLFNVLRGEMSFIGPRPERPVFVAEFMQTVPGYAHRHQVKPGITGLAQVNGFYDTDAVNKLKYDLYYIHNYSLWLDFLIAVDTLKTMIGRKGM